MVEPRTIEAHLPRTFVDRIEGDGMNIFYKEAGPPNTNAAQIRSKAERH